MSALYDSHCHLDFDAYDADRAAVIARALASGVETILVPGVRREQWERARGLEGAGMRLRSAVGLHPQAIDVHGRDETDSALEELDAWIVSTGAAAIGELGWDTKIACASAERQTQIASAQIALARERQLPIILHVLGPHALALDRLEASGSFHAGGVVHSYSGSADLVPRYLALGLHLSFGPSVTRPSARRPLEAVRATPLDRLLVETDGPDQFVSGRASRRGEPADLGRIVDAIARARGETPARVAQITTQNARALFG